MQNRGQLVIGAILIGLGIIFLIGEVFEINLWAFCFPIGLIAVGGWILLRPNLSNSGVQSDIVLLGEVKKRGDWEVGNREYWVGIGDVDLDMIHARIPTGETRITIYGFVNDVDILLPEDVEFAVNANGFVQESALLGQKFERFLSPVEYASEGYAAAQRKIHFETLGFVTDLKISRL